MNIFLIASLISTVYVMGKMGLSYKNVNVKACIQDALLVFVSSAVGLYGYDKYGAQQMTTKPTEVFNEKPNF